MTLRDRRIAAGYTQADIARMVDVDQSSVSMWESGKTKPVAKYKRKLAAIYGVTPEKISECLTEE